MEWNGQYALLTSGKKLVLSEYSCLNSVSSLLAKTAKLVLLA